ncbi:MAG: hypothetical protein IT450_11475 [Phycisphaerales bacterium]|nr:hypothetical protein [Phycisphaerales bacterium]
MGIFRLLPLLAISLSGLGCIDVPGVPAELPATLARLRENSDLARPNPDALAGVPAGTVLDDAAALDGCWGRFFETEAANPETGELVRVISLVVWRFDMAAGTHDQNLLLDNASLSPFRNEVVYVGTTSTIEVYEQRAPHLIGRDGEAAGVRPDGRLVFDRGASILASINETTSYPILFTLSGDTLKVVEGGYDQLPADLIIGQHDDLAKSGCGWSARRNAR